MQIKIDRNSRTPMYIQIRNQIRAMISTAGFGRDLLPPERKLAESGVNRSTVLTTQGTEGRRHGGLHVGRGTMVLSAMSEVSESYGEFIPL